MFTAHLLSADLCHLLNETSLSSEEGTAQLMSQQVHLIKATPEGERLGGGQRDWAVSPSQRAEESSRAMAREPRVQAS